MEGVGLVRLKKGNYVGNNIETSINSNSGAGSPFVKLSYDKQKFKTAFQKNEVDPCWKEMFFL